MADLRITDKNGMTHIHEPGPIARWISADNQYMGYVLVSKESDVTIVSTFHEILVEGT